MKKTNRDRELAYLDELIDEITTDANGEDEQLWAFRQAFDDDVAAPCEATVIGEPVQVLKFDYDGNELRGLTATCRRADGTKHVVSASEVVIPLSTQGGRYLAAYRKWMGIAPFPPGSRGKARRQPAAAAPDLDGPLELVVLSVKQKAARCRLLGSDRRALGLVPLRLEERGLWSPAEHYWGEEGEPIEDWAKPVIARGPRPEFEMEQVLPGAGADDSFCDPIGESNDRKDSGDREGAYKMVMDLCQADFRCLASALRKTDPPALR